MSKPIVILNLLLITLAGTVSADSVRLHDAAGTEHARVTLGDVAELEGPYAESLSDISITAFREGATRLTVTLDAVRAALASEGVNWGRLSLQGYNACEVHRTLPPAAPERRDDSPVIANVDQEIALDTAVTVRDLLIGQIEALTGADGADLRIAFRPNDDDLLNRSAIGGRIELAPTTSATLGRLGFKYRRYDGLRITEEQTITLDVERRFLGLATTRTIKRGETFNRDDVVVREFWLDRADPPLTDPKLVAGQAAAKLLRADSPVHADAVEAPVLVRRNELITVRCHSGGLVIRTVARAKEDGAMDQAIKAVNEKTRESFLVTVVARREGVVMLNPETIE